ncbi:MAG: CsbD family protein [Oligoflexus sp.]|nr:CsbD family protein [Oligoflexus sp.]
MNWDQIEGQWKDLKGSVREKWAKFTDDDVELIAGKKDRFVGKLQERYGLAKDRAELEVDDYIKGMNKEKSKLS